jgi:ribonuclease HI
MIKNPHAIYIYCDGSMDLGSKGGRGTGYFLDFQENVPLENISYSSGGFQDGNIEQLELSAILSGLNALYQIFIKQKELFRSIREIIVVTDRFALAESRLKPYTIINWRKNKWLNHEQKPIKNKELIDQIDKSRTKISKEMSCRIEIVYTRRKNNRNADKLAKIGKKETNPRRGLYKSPIKIGKPIYNEAMVNYLSIKKGQVFIIRPFFKEVIKNSSEIKAEIMEGDPVGERITIITSLELADKLHRGNNYVIIIERVNKYHVTILEEIQHI